jgi:acetyl esterase/lipase
MDESPVFRRRRRWWPPLFSVYALLLAACSPVGALNALTPQRSFVLDAAVAYGSGERERLDIYQPSGPAMAGEPVVVFLYGGSWNSGRREEYRFLGEALASAGVLTVIPDYRLYPEVTYPSFLEDNARAVAWVFQHIHRYGGNPQNVFLMGHSAGAYNAAMLALDPRWLGARGLSPASLRGWIGLAGPYDFYPITYRNVRPIFQHPDYPARSQPVDFVGDDSQVPVFLGAARHDHLVDPKRNTEGLATLLRGAGTPGVERIYTGVGHQTLIGAFARTLRWMAPVRQDVLRFIAQESQSSGVRTATAAAPVASRSRDSGSGR